MLQICMFHGREINIKIKHIHERFVYLFIYLFIYLFTYLFIYLFHSFYLIDWFLDYYILYTFNSCYRFKQV